MTMAKEAKLQPQVPGELTYLPDPEHAAKVTRPLEWFKPHEANPRKHSPEAIAQFALALKRFGFRAPILAKSTGEVVDGHFRLKAAQHLKLTEVPVLLVDDMSEAEVKAFRLSVNRMAELADWDQDLLLNNLVELQTGGEVLGPDGPIGFELEAFDPKLAVESWDFSPTKDRFVITLTGSKPFEAEVRERLKGLNAVHIEVSTLEE
jgi:hypothetical protein